VNIVLWQRHGRKRVGGAQLRYSRGTLVSVVVPLQLSGAIRRNPHAHANARGADVHERASMLAGCHAPRHAECHSVPICGVCAHGCLPARTGVRVHARACVRAYVWVRVPVVQKGALRRYIRSVGGSFGKASVRIAGRSCATLRTRLERKATGRQSREQVWCGGVKALSLIVPLAQGPNPQRSMHIHARVNAYGADVRAPVCVANAPRLVATSSGSVCEGSFAVFSRRPAACSHLVW
jgi:hypothetical protein